MHPAFLYVPGERLTVAELSAARLDGHVVEIGECYIPADLVEGPDTRAASLSTMITAGYAVSGPSAAWVHGAGNAPPSPHHARRVAERRQRSRLDHRLIIHDALVPAIDVRVHAGVPVTTPGRTLLDLALLLHRDESHLTWLRRLAGLQPWLLPEAERVLTGLVRVPGTRVARAALATLPRGQEVVTRYTS